ncbi:MAG: glycoside hydrolase family 13 protein [Lachnospiraceae bacterium]|nr:glycoside hydrolase family 13 protein [Lachnospiraceae bacterium]
MSLNIEDIFEKEKYLFNMRPILNRDALFSDYSSDYLVPWEPTKYGQVKIRFRTAKNNVDHVYIIVNGDSHVMYKESTVGRFDYYEYILQLENELMVYFFEAEVGSIKCQYDLRGAVDNVDMNFFFEIRPGFSTPEWAKGAVFYQIYVDRFYNGDPTNDVLTGEYTYIGDKSVKVEDWDKYPATMGVREFYGGDLQGVIDKMDYLESLGIDAIYFNPLFVSPSNHKYDIQDYDYIDPHFGRIVDDRGSLLDDTQTENRLATRYINRVTNKKNLEASNELFIKVVEEAHRRGIKVILDGVFNHCGSFNKWLDKERIYENSEDYEKGAFVDENSPYHDFFRFFDDRAWPYNGSYDGWWGHDTLPKLNYEGSQKLYDYILGVAEKWVRPPYNIDGWRLDVAADLGYSGEFNHHFWQDFRRVVKNANKDAIIIAEHYGDPSSWLQGNEWDTVMNYDAFMEPVTWFLTGMQKHSDDFRPDMLGNADAFWDTMVWNTAKLPAPSMYVSMNELSNHDHSRFLTRTNHKVGRVDGLGAEAANEGINKAVMREAVMVQMTWPGAPTIYYGDEAGVCGFTDPDNRRTYPWGHEDQEMIEFHRQMIKVHKENPELKAGSYKELYRDYNVLCYGRFNTEEQSIVIINNNDHSKELDIKFGWKIGAMDECVAESIMYTDEDGFNTDRYTYIIDKGRLFIKLRSFCGIVLKIIKV